MSGSTNTAGNVKFAKLKPVEVTESLIVAEDSEMIRKGLEAAELADDEDPFMRAPKPKIMVSQDVQSPAVVLRETPRKVEDDLRAMANQIVSPLINPNFVRLKTSPTDKEDSSHENEGRSSQNLKKARNGVKFHLLLTKKFFICSLFSLFLPF